MNKYLLRTFLFIGSVFLVKAQGPPITTDSPIALGGNSFTVKTLTELRFTERGSFNYLPLVFNYLPTSNSSVEIQIPFINFDTFLEDDQGLADIKILGKYQFFKKDLTGKSLRLEVKTIQTLPTGIAIDAIGLSTGFYSGYYGLVAGYETLKYGLYSEFGYNWSPNGTIDELRYKLGAGLPLLKPQYPNKQLNLYFEYTNSWVVERDWYQLLYSQGIQYAGKNYTIDFAVQLPLVNDVTQGREFNYSLFIGSRYTF